MGIRWLVRSAASIVLIGSMWAGLLAPAEGSMLPATAPGPTPMTVLTTPPDSGTQTFTDVPPGAQFYAEIQWLASQGISTGWLQPDNTRLYMPLANVARDAMAAFMYRLAGSPAYTAPAVSPFTDITPSTHFYKEITWLATKRISTGWTMPGGTTEFRPLSPVNRDAMAAFMYRLAGSPAYTAPATSPFTDITPSTHFYKEITWLAANKISTGWSQPDGNAVYQALGPVARDAMAAFMYRAHPLIPAPLADLPPVTAVQATSPSATEVDLTWSNPADARYAGVAIRRALGSTAPASEADGTAVAEVQGPGTSFVDTSVSANMTYTYSLFAHDASNITHAAATTVTVTTPASTPACLPVQHVSGTLPASATWGTSCHTVYVLDQDVTVPAGTTLKVAPGTVIKGTSNAAIHVDGALAVNGAAGSPVVFTSLQDDSAGGDTNGDGTATTPGPWDWGGIILNPQSGAALQMTHAEVKYSVYGVHTGWWFGSGTTVSGPVSISDSVISGGGEIYLEVAGQVAVTRNQVLGGLGISTQGIWVRQTGNPQDLPSSTTVVSSNTVTGSLSDGIKVTGPPMGNYVVPAPTVQGNTVTGARGRAIAVGFSTLDPSTLTGNTGTGNKVNTMSWSGSLGANLTLPLQGLPFMIGTDWCSFIPSVPEPCAFRIPAGVTMTVGAGTVIKADTRAATVPAKLQVDGSLVVNGVAGSPATFSSAKDDSAGGDTNGDGTATTPAPGDWDGIDVSSTGMLTAGYLDIRYASTLITNSGNVIMHDATLHLAQQCLSSTDAAGTTSVTGKIIDCPDGLHGSQQIDARNVDWGTAAGPAPFGPGVTNTGDVLVVPWAGYTAPSPAPSPPAGGWSASTNTCSPLLVIGVRGSGEVPGGPSSVATDPTLYDAFTYAQMVTPPGQEFRGLGSKVQSILTGQTVVSPGVVDKKAQGFLDDLQPADGSTARIMPLVYPAADTKLLSDLIVADNNPVGGLYSPESGQYIHLTLKNFAAYLSSIQSGITELEIQLSNAVYRCPNQKIVLSGYSQGAMVIQMALADMQANPATLNYKQVVQSGLIKNVILLANPLQDPTRSIGSYLGTGSTQGLITELIAFPAVKSVASDFFAGVNPSAPYPNTLNKATISYCTAGDIMCAPMNQYSKSIHGSYSPSQLAVLGTSAAATYYK